MDKNNLPDGYVHRPPQCRLCFKDNEKISTLGEWKLYNNPGYWGSPNPKILVLGFSKGRNQNIETKNFEKIPFAGARPRLERVFKTLNIMPPNRSIDDLMKVNEQTFGVASLVRCSICKIKGEKCRTSGDVIPSAFTNASTKAIIQRCANTFLGKLPDSVKLVVLLGTSDNYIRETEFIFAELYSDYESINPCAFRAGGALWVYATHPSPGNGHFKSWEEGKDNTSAQKRIFALQALSSFPRPY